MEFQSKMASLQKKIAPIVVQTPCFILKILINMTTNNLTIFRVLYYAKGAFVEDQLALNESGSLH